MPENELERHFNIWRRFVAAIPYAVAKYRDSPKHPSDAAVARYEEGMQRYARMLENAAAAYIVIQRKR